MTAKPLKGRALARRLRRRTAKDVREFQERTGHAATIAAVMVGDDQGALNYARAQSRASGNTGIGYRLVRLPGDCRMADAMEAIDRLNLAAEITGIILLTPVPTHLNQTMLQWRIAPSKDLEGVSPGNMGHLLADTGIFFTPPTPAAAMALLDSLDLELSGQQAVVVGHSAIVGKPLAMRLLNRRCTVTIAHAHTRNLASHTTGADILCVAVGKPGLITGNYVKKGAVVLDIGTTYVGKTVLGDCDPDSVSSKAGWLTPVPGGIGPLTTIMLMRNAYRALARQLGEAIWTEWDWPSVEE